MEDMPSAPQPEHQHQHMHEHVAPAEHVEPQHQEMPAAEPMHGDYPSSPITTAKNALTALWRNGGSVFGGIVAVEALVAIVTGLAFVIALLAALIALLGNYLVNSGALDAFISNMSPQASPETLQSFASILRAGTAASVVAIISGVIAAFGLAYMQAIYLSYVGFTVVKRQAAHFGQIMGLAFKRTGPLMVQVVIILAAVALLIALPFMLMPATPVNFDAGVASGLGLLAYFLVVLVVVIMVGLRLSFAPLAVVAEQMGPIKAFGYSWRLTKKRVWEILGVASLVGVAGTIASLVFLLLESLTQSATGLSLVFGILELVWGVALGVAGVAVIAERFNQANSAGQVHHKVNYTLNVAMFVLAIIVSLIASDIAKTVAPASPAYNLPSNFQNSNPSTPTEQQLQQELQKYYQDSQNMQNSAPSTNLPTTDPGTSTGGGYQLN